jgi:hypothetical protein
MLDSSLSCSNQRLKRIYRQGRHLRYDVDALSRAIDFARKTPDAIPLIRDNRLSIGFVPSHHIHKTSFNAGLTAGTFFSVNFDVGTHASSRTDL